MEKTEEMLQSATAGNVVIAASSFGKYFAVGSLILFVLSLTTGILNYPLLAKIATLLFTAAQFFAWRLYLDKFLFQILYDKTSSVEHFDGALNFLFARHRGGKTYTQRWLGTKRLLCYVGLCLLGQVLFLLVGIG